MPKTTHMSWSSVARPVEPELWLVGRFDRSQTEGGRNIFASVQSRSSLCPDLDQTVVWGLVEPKMGPDAASQQLLPSHLSCVHLVGLESLGTCCFLCCFHMTRCEPIIAKGWSMKWYTIHEGMNWTHT
jgi:hypothetical protein